MGVIVLQIKYFFFLFNCKVIKKKHFNRVIVILLVLFKAIFSYLTRCNCLLIINDVLLRNCLDGNNVLRLLTCLIHFFI